MTDILNKFAIHVGTRAALPLGEQRTWHEQQANLREKELRDFIFALAAELRLVKTEDPERRAMIDALLAAHPGLIT